MVTSVAVVSSLVLHLVLSLNYDAIVHDGLNFKDQCQECDTSTGSGYAQHPKYCHLFLHCSMGGDGQLSGRVKECSRGLLWSQALKQCVWPQQADCPHNPCNDQSLSLRDVRSCNGYFSCPSGQRLDFSCCPADHRYDEGQGRCVPDPSCSDPCLPGSAKVTAEMPVCERYAMEGDIRQYLWQVGGRNVTMTCAAGTSFSPHFCSCADTSPLSITPSPESCGPYIWFPFDSGLEDRQGNTASAGNADVIPALQGSLGGGAAFFGGGTEGVKAFGAIHVRYTTPVKQVVVWAMNNMEFRSNFTLTFRFRSELPPDTRSTDTKRYALIDNSDCDKEATFGVALLVSPQGSATVHGGFRLKNGRAYTASSKNLVVDRWHDVVMMKHGPRAELLVDGVRHPIDGPGLEADIDRVDCAMTIGTGTGLQDFVGYIDEVKYYKCVPDQYL